jgi:hypothetical protein
VDVAARLALRQSTHVPFGHGHQPLGPFLTHERGMLFTSVQPSGASLGRFCLEAGRLGPLSPELSHLPVTRDARLGRDTWTSQGLRRMNDCRSYPHTSSTPSATLCWSQSELLGCRIDLLEETILKTVLSHPTDSPSSKPPISVP